MFHKLEPSCKPGLGATRFSHPLQSKANGVRRYVEPNTLTRGHVPTLFRDPHKLKTIPCSRTKEAQGVVKHDYPERGSPRLRREATRGLEYERSELEGEEAGSGQQPSR